MNRTILILLCFLFLLSAETHSQSLDLKLGGSLYKQTHKTSSGQLFGGGIFFNKNRSNPQRVFFNAQALQSAVMFAYKGFTAEAFYYLDKMKVHNNTSLTSNYTSLGAFGYSKQYRNFSATLIYQGGGIALGYQFPIVKNKRALLHVSAGYAIETLSNINDFTGKYYDSSSVTDYMTLTTVTHVNDQPYDIKEQNGISLHQNSGLWLANVRLKYQFTPSWGAELGVNMHQNISAQYHFTKLNQGTVDYSQWMTYGITFSIFYHITWQRSVSSEKSDGL